MSPWRERCVFGTPCWALSFYCLKEDTCMLKGDFLQPGAPGQVSCDPGLGEALRACGWSSSLCPKLWGWIHS